MSQPTRSILRESLGLVRVGLMLRQAALVSAVSGLSVLWLHMPDASAMDVVGSVLLGLLVVWTAGAGETALFLRLCGTARTKRRLLLGAVLVLVGIGVWIWVSSSIDHLRLTDWRLAGYLNSRASFRWRNLFSFAHISLWLGWMWTAVEWVVAGAIAAVVFPAVASVRHVHAVWRVLRSITYWVSLAIGAAAASAVTGLLMSWTPGHGLRVEIASLVLRVGVALLVDCAAAVFVLAVAAVCVRRAEVGYETSEGTPEASQPRTVDNP